MAAGKGGNTVKIVRELAQPIIEELGLVLWDVRFVKEGATYYLRIFIDKKDGSVGIDDCESVSRRLDKLLDEADPIDCSYCLEVSSPGIERELVRAEHFESALGEKIKIRLIRAIDGARDFKGTLLSYENGVLTAALDDGSQRSFEKKDISSVKSDDFGGF